MTRRESREQAFVLLFEKSFQADVTMQEIISVGVENELMENDEFAQQLALTAWNNLEKIDGVIEESLVGWRMNRISKVALAVLRLAVCEILYFDDVPVGATINEAVELGKKYGGQDDFSFVNGILGTVAKKYAATEGEQ